MNEIVVISIGGFIGAINRFVISKKIQNSEGFPIGTLTVNLMGAFLLGMIFGLEVKGTLYSLLGIGFMGAFTTFSTLMLEAVKLKQEEKKKLYYSYLLSSYILGIMLTIIGLWLGRAI
ncbi:CrcB family protein [Bacillus sp. sid0103]|uniref:fluoride efflux transporter FluC n=1 Tax=Bacillus sp. sid0103 TaxID=2856337 RepID=UPI001C490420|nr:CrcB family protein [Bacillus sp. sid0103]MBV7506836.1 CrcB family protein [Bacillus sp. sid0103]